MTEIGEKTGAVLVVRGGEGESDNNVVRVVGRVSGDPQERALPSGDRLVTFRIVLPRPAGYPSKQRVDVLDCAVRAPELLDAASSWHDGDRLEVYGAIRRRFFRGASGTAASRVEIEVAAGRMVTSAESE